MKRNISNACDNQVTFKIEFLKCSIIIKIFFSVISIKWYLLKKISS